MSPRIVRSALLLALATAAVPVPDIGAQTPAPSGTHRATIPDSPIGRAFGEWLDAFNSADSVRLGAYYRKYGLQRSLEFQMARRAQTGGFDVVSIERSEPRLLEFVVQERNSDTRAYGVTELSPDGSRLTQSSLSAIPRGASVASFRIDAATRARVIENAIAQLDSHYVFPDVAKQMATAVRARLKRGEYDAVTNGLTFANLLTAHFRDVSRDRHLGVNFAAGGVPNQTAGQRPDSAAQARHRSQLLRDNCGFVKVEQLPGNVGYVKFNFFGEPDICGPTASAAMNFVANADALIVDLRDNGGGDPAMVAYVSSWLFPRRTHLNDIWERTTNRTEEYWTNPDVPGTKLGEGRPVFVLTSSRTFSGAEEFSYNLKNLKRATIVGETTGGGAHPVSGHRIDERFTIGVPFARAINPITKTNWEGTGVEPDVKVPASDALATALKLIGGKPLVP